MDAWSKLLLARFAPKKCSIRDIVSSAMKTACGGQSIKHDHGAELRHLVVWRKQEKDGQSVWRARWERPVAIGADDQRIDSATLRSFFLDPREWKADVGSASAIHVHRR